MAFLQKKKDSETELRSILDSNPIISFLVSAMHEEENQWAIQATGYYDRCRREILFGSDSLFITASDDNDDHKTGLRYTSLGWVPMSDVTLPSGSSVSEKSMLVTWAKIISEALAKEFPELRFDGDIYSFSENGKYYVRVNYSVKKKEYNKWV